MNLKNVLFDLLRPFGITNNYTGCSQLIRAIEIVLEKPDGIQVFESGGTNLQVSGIRNQI